MNNVPQLKYICSRVLGLKVIQNPLNSMKEFDVLSDLCSSLPLIHLATQMNPYLPLLKDYSYMPFMLDMVLGVSPSNINPSYIHYYNVSTGVSKFYCIPEICKVTVATESKHFCIVSGKGPYYITTYTIVDDEVLMTGSDTSPVMPDNILITHSNVVLQYKLISRVLSSASSRNGLIVSGLKSMITYRNLPYVEHYMSGITKVNGKDYGRTSAPVCSQNSVKFSNATHHFIIDGKGKETKYDFLPGDSSMSKLGVVLNHSAKQVRMYSVSTTEPKKIENVVAVDKSTSVVLYQDGVNLNIYYLLGNMTKIVPNIFRAGYLNITIGIHHFTVRWDTVPTTYSSYLLNGDLIVENTTNPLYYIITGHLYKGMSTRRQHYIFNPHNNASSLARHIEISLGLLLDNTITN